MVKLLTVPRSNEGRVFLGRDHCSNPTYQTATPSRYDPIEIGFMGQILQQL